MKKLGGLGERDLTLHDQHLRKVNKNIHFTYAQNKTIVFCIRLPPRQHSISVEYPVVIPVMRLQSLSGRMVIGYPKNIPTEISTGYVLCTSYGRS